MPSHALDQASILDLAEQAAVIIRELTHRTRGRHAFTEPAELARLLDALTATATGLPQLLDQLGHWLTHEHDAERLQATHNHTDELVTTATTSLTHGRHAAHTLTAALDAAHQQAAHLATATPNRTPCAEGVNFHP
jgi:hypothetical protein